ncbi:PH domain-containing protein [Shewanella subflava]|uniref:PH domain-containing protein n=1 Tax=Shewanella subflava TaxID=2986476 RepID=A0ABT3IAI5_9GAMM|nr:PH domain-containing protein [Shewanella subflava]MCW3173037.1 PH domain-containing protein [Shewanella subflava]
MNDIDHQHQSLHHTDIYQHGEPLQPQQLTPLTELVLTHIDNNYPKLQLYVAGIVYGLIATIVCLIIGFIVPLSITAKLLLILFILITAALIIRLTYLKALTICYGVFKGELIMRQGLFWISTTALPYTRLQHVNLSQGPLERQYQLVTLKCFSAGSGEAEINLPGLNADTAEHLRQHLLHQAAENQTTNANVITASLDSQHG